MEVTFGLANANHCILEAGIMDYYQVLCSISESMLPSDRGGMDIMQNTQKCKDIDRNYYYEPLMYG